MKPTYARILGGGALIGVCALALLHPRGLPEVLPEVAKLARDPAAAPAAGPTTEADPSAPAAAAVEDETWVTGEWIVVPKPGVSLETLAARYGLQVRRPLGRSGAGAIGGDGISPSEAAALGADLANDAEVAEVSRQAYVYAAEDEAAVETEGVATAGSLSLEGAGGESDPATQKLRKLQWYLDQIAAPSSPPAGIHTVVVAILDSGVAYTTNPSCVGLGCPVAAPSLSGVTIVAPADMVDGDALPLDVHQHGTHIASIILSQGKLRGVAAGASLMPIRVLDQNKRGTELDLIEGILHAVDQGADVVNMSLSFTAAYAPSSRLRAALQEAHEAGIVLVAAAGNTARTVDAWPAASPVVASVGASSLSSATASKATAPYSSTSKSLDLMAPGGDLSRDMNADGYPDGILGESILLNQPDKIGYFLCAGTSQAAAVVTGAVANLLAAGVPPEDTLAVLHQEATSWDASLLSVRLPGDSIRKGTGAGGLDLGGALSRVSAGTARPGRDLVASVYPYLERPSFAATGVAPADEKFRPAARIEVRTANGQPMSSAVGVAVTITDGQTTLTPNCLIPAGGTGCTVRGSYVPAHTEAAWLVTVNGVYWTPDSSAVEAIARPEPALWASDALEVLLRAVDGTGLASSPLGIYSGFTYNTDLGARTAEGYSLLNTGTGLASSPLGLVLTPGMLSPTSTQSVSLDLDGTGLASSPLGLISATLLTFDGTGLASSPLGITSFSLLTLDGTGLASSPLGFSAFDLISPVGAMGYDADGVDLNSTMVNLVTGESTQGIAGTALQDFVEAGGDVLGDQVSVPEALLLSQTVALSYTGLYLPDEEAAVTDGGAAGVQVTP